MDIILVVAGILFGILITIGNERQRKAIDALREQVVSWAIQDLRIKREKVEREIRIEDPIQWLNEMASKAYGEALGLTLVEVAENPTALVCTANNGWEVVISPSLATKRARNKGSRLKAMQTAHPLQHIPRGAKVLELSVLNSGIFFDVELAQAWLKITQQHIQEDRIFCYIS